MSIDVGAIDHFDAFYRFCEAELATGGPDPQVLLTARASELVAESEAEAAWFAGCFVGPYTCGATGPLFMGTCENDSLATLTWFISRNWDGLPRRRERRAIDKRSGEKLAECLLSWRVWIENEWPHVRRQPYSVVYASVRKHCKFFGRYATMKVLEVLYQACLINKAQDSICAAGAKFPRRTLALLFPEHAEVLNSTSDRPEVINLCDWLAKWVKDEADVETWFAFETLLCNYRQALAGKYPGRSHDRELTHFRKAEEYWGPKILEWFPFYELRAKLFPHRCLGELGGWDGARSELEVPFT